MITHTTAAHLSVAHSARGVGARSAQLDVVLEALAAVRARAARALGLQHVLGDAVLAELDAAAWLAHGVRHLDEADLALVAQVGGRGDDRLRGAWRNRERVVVRGR